MTDINLPGKLIEDLGKSGFGSELAALRMFHRGPFRTVAGKVYFDQILNRQRAIDLSAEKTEHTQNALTFDWLCMAVMSVVGEVKKSEKPWVVLKSGSYENPQTIYMNESLIETVNVREPTFYIREALAKNFLAMRDPWFGHGIHEAFKKPDELGRWFKAASSVCRASISVMAEARRDPQEKLATIRLTQPLVVLDGRLFCATSREDFQVELQEITRATLLHQETNPSFDRRFLIDLVVLKSLPAYVDELNVRLKFLHDQLVQKVAASASK